MSSLLLDELDLLKISNSISDDNNNNNNNNDDDEESDSDEEEILLLTPLQLLGNNKQKKAPPLPIQQHRKIQQQQQQTSPPQPSTTTKPKSQQQQQQNIQPSKKKSIKKIILKRAATPPAPPQQQQQQQAQIQKPLLKKTLSQEYHQNILLEKAKAQEALGTKMDDLSKITKHPPNPTKYLIDKSVKHMLSPKLHGRTTGDRPNILFGWIQDEVLNKHPLYQALPHISRVNRTIGSRWLSQFEQHSYQSSEIHVGRITTRHLSSALGMHESGRANKCFIPKHRVGSKGAIKAFNEILRIRNFIKTINKREETYGATINFGRRTSYSNYKTGTSSVNNNNNNNNNNNDEDKYIFTSSKRTTNMNYQPNKLLKTNIPNYSYLSSMSNIGQELFALPLNPTLHSDTSINGKNMLTKTGKIVITTEAALKGMEKNAGGTLLQKKKDGVLKETELISPGTLVLPIAELTEKRVQKRQRQIQLGKMSEGYQNYIAKVPKEKRIPNELKHPKTPDVYLKVSKRNFEKQMRNWRNLLHLWDDPNVDPLQDMAELRLSAGAGGGGSGRNSPTGLTRQLSGQNGSFLSLQTSDGLDLSNNELKKMISASFTHNDTWCLDTSNDNVLVNKGQTLLGIHVYHEDKRPGTKMVLYANDCMSRGKQWEYVTVKSRGTSATTMSNNNKFATPFLKSLKGEYIFIKSKLNGYVVTIMEEDTKYLRQNNKNNSITIETLNHSYRVALMPLGKTEREQRFQLWRKKVVEKRVDNLDWCKFYWYENGKHPVVNNNVEEEEEEDSDDDDLKDLDLNDDNNNNGMDGKFLLSILSAEDSELIDLQKQNATRHKLKHLHANQWWKRDMSDGGIYKYDENAPQLRATRPIPHKFKHSGEIAMAWGGVQEAVALVCLMDFFPNAKMKETGCLLLETILENVKDVYDVSLDDLPLIGASPDGTLVLKNGELQIVEVKCSCPYADNKSGGSSGGWRRPFNNNKGGRFTIIDKPSIKCIPAYHIPQLQMEILCTGPYCTCGWYVSYNATRGVSIFRIERDNEYIQHMLKLLVHFKKYGREAFNKYKDEFDAFTDRSLRKSKSISKWKHVLPEHVPHMKGTMRWFQ